MPDMINTPQKYISAAALRQELGLTLSHARIDTLLAAYRAEQRVPTAIELRTLDALLYDPIMKPSVSPLLSFQTEDAETAAIFGDLIEKSKDIRGKAPLPTPASALCVASETLAHEGISPPPPKGALGEQLVLISAEDYATLPYYGLRPLESMPLDGTPWRMVKVVNDDPCLMLPSANGDLCSLLLSPEDADGQEHLLHFFSRKDIQKLIHYMRAVSRGTYLEVLLSRANGYDIDLSALPGLTDLCPAEAVPKLPSGYLIFTDQTSTRLLMEQARQSELIMAAFARVNNTFKLTFSTHGVTDFSFPTPQLRNLVQPRSIQVRTANQSASAQQALPIRHGRIGNDTIAYCSFPLLPTLTSAEVLSAFQKTMDTLLSQSGDLKTAYAALGLGEHADTSPCGLWSAVLGVHRGLCEQNIPSLLPTFTHANKGELTLCLIAQTLPTYHADICSSSQSAPTAQEQTEQSDASHSVKLPAQEAKNP